MTQQDNQPALYQLSGDGIQITYMVNDAEGQPEFNCQISNENHSIVGDQISTQESPLGTLVTVFLLRTIDAGSITLTLLVPGVNFANTSIQNIDTYAVVSNNSFSIPDLHRARQTQTFQVYHLQGEVSAASADNVVTLSVDSNSYSIGDPITVTLTNGRSAPIYFPDHLTNCTVVRLQRQVNGNWEDVHPCVLTIATQMHSLDAGQSLNVDLDSVTDTAGLYRATLVYKLSATTNFQIGPLILVQSPQFQVS